MKKVIRIGSSYGVTLSKDILKKLGVEHGDEVDISYNSRKQVIEIKSANKNGSAIEEVMNRYKDELTKI